mmetsp:Transcript_6076/g.11500  ORF Transcript_6076/g.11500 Transcript_6076/m.11500 type:complete len:81 (-) Transcript_6076:85-327(-)
MCRMNGGHTTLPHGSPRSKFRVEVGRQRWIGEREGRRKISRRQETGGATAHRLPCSSALLQQLLTRRMDVCELSGFFLRL